MGEPGSHLCVTKAQLTISVATTDEQISSLCQSNRMILTRSDCFDFLPSEVLYEFRQEDVLGRAMAKLSLLSVTKGIQSAIGCHYHRMLASARDSFDVINLDRLLCSTFFFLHQF